MSIQEIIELVKSNFRKLLFGGFLFFLLGIFLYFYYPQYYIAQGSLYITRGVSTNEILVPQPETFTYEGFYAQQNAQSYTATVLALIESTDLKVEVLRDMQMPVDTLTLRKLSQYIDVKKTGPQLILLTVKTKSPELSESIWYSVAERVQEKNIRINSKGDPKLEIVLVSSDPLNSPTYRNIYLNASLGLIFGIVGVFAVLLVQQAAYISSSTKKKK